MSVYDVNGNVISSGGGGGGDSAYFYPNKVKAVAHRKNRRSNFIAAYQLGFPYIEVDVNRTTDGYIVMEHDQITTTYSSWKNGSSDKLTFEEWIALNRKLAVHPYIELKQWLTTADCETIVGLVNDYGLTGRVTYLLSGNNSNISAKMLEIAPDERYGYLTYTSTSEILAWKQAGHNVFADIGPTVVDGVSQYSDATINNYKTNGIEVEAWTINDAATMLALNPWVTGVTSDSVLFDQVLLDSVV